MATGPQKVFYIRSKSECLRLALHETLPHSSLTSQMIENIRALDAFSAPRTIKENDGYFAAQLQKLAHVYRR